jgi:hypothetical protein
MDFIIIIIIIILKIKTVSWKKQYRLQAVSSLPFKN